MAFLEVLDSSRKSSEHIILRILFRSLQESFLESSWDSSIIPSLVVFDKLVNELNFGKFRMTFKDFSTINEYRT